MSISSSDAGQCEGKPPHWRLTEPPPLTPSAMRSSLFAPATGAAPPRICIVAEIGVNHDGDLDRAVQLVEAASQCGADVVKFQLFDPRYLLSNQATLADYQKSNETDVFDMLDRLKLGLDDIHTVRAEARRHNMGIIVTPFSLEDIRTLESLDVDAVKIASPDAVNHPLLERAAALNRPMIVSTGTATLDELTYVVNRLRHHRAGGCLLQCVSSYPTPLEDAGLGGMVAMARYFELPVGYSDHTNQPTTGALAVAAGACVVEKHLTYNRAASGPDHAASFDPNQFANYVHRIRQASVMYGPIDKAICEAEIEVRKLCRQSVCARRDLATGHVLTEADLTVKRPGTGIPAAQFDQVVGRRLRSPVMKNDLVNEVDMM